MEAHLVQQKTRNLFSLLCVLLLGLYFSVMPVLSLFVPKPMGIVLIIIGVICFLAALLTRTRLEIRFTLPVLFLLFLATGYAGALWSPDSDIVIERANKLAPFFAATIFLLLVSDKLDLASKIRILRFLPHVVFLAGILAVSEYFLDYPLYRLIRGIDEGERLRPAILNRGMVFASLMIWPACLWLQRTGNKKYVMPLVMTTLFAALLVYSSQSALFGIAGGILAWVLMGIEKHRLRVMQAIFILVALCAVLSPWIAKSLYITQPESVKEWKAASAHQRVTIWNAIAQEVEKQPLHGYGLDATEILSGKITQHTAPYKWEKVYHPHNFALQLWIELGLAGIIFFLSLLYMFYQRIRSCDAYAQQAMIACLVTAISIGAVGYNLWQSWWLGSLLSAATACYMLREEKRA